jgi:hypothetical protein
MMDHDELPNLMHACTIPIPAIRYCRHELGPSTARGQGRRYGSGGWITKESWKGRADEEEDGMGWEMAAGQTIRQRQGPSSTKRGGKGPSLLVSLACSATCLPLLTLSLVLCLVDTGVTLGRSTASRASTGRAGSRERAKYLRIWSWSLGFFFCVESWN